MRSLFFLVIFPALLLCISSSIVLASFISLTSQADSVFMTSLNAYSNISITNSGDEAANNVAISLVLPDGFSSNQIYAGKIRSNSTFSSSFNISAVNITTGSYTASILTEYQDANGYQFSSVSPITLIYKNPTKSKIRLSIENSQLYAKGSAKLNVKITNSDSQDRNLLIKIFLPNELVSGEMEKRVFVGKNSEKDIDFDISNQGALVGSTYAVFASADYDDAFHYSGFTVGTIGIVKEEVDKTNWLLIIAMVLVAAFIIINFGYNFLKR